MPQEEKFVKFTKLYILIFLLFLSIPVITGLILFGFYKFSALISSRPVDMAFELIVACIPAAIILTVNCIFFIRTKKHPSKIVRTISYCCFIIAFAGCITALVVDISSFFTQHGHNITDYKSYSQLFLAGNIALLFIIALLQAFTTNKEKDWMERARERGIDQ